MRVDDSRFPHLWFVFTQALIDLANWNLCTMPECLLRSQCTHKHLQLKDFYFKNAVRNVKEEENTHGTMWCIVLTFPFKAYTPENTHTHRHANYKKYIDPLLMADRFPRQLRVWSVLYALYCWKIQLGEPFPPCCSILLCLRWHQSHGEDLFSDIGWGEEESPVAFSSWRTGLWGKPTSSTESRRTLVCLGSLSAHMLKDASIIAITHLLT